MTSALCPEEETLLALVLSNPVADEVHAHTQGCLACRERLERLGSEVAALRRTTQWRPEPVSETAAAAAPASERPATIGKYLIVGTLGHGGQAEVYRAFHPTLGRDVVIKLSHQPLRATKADQDCLVAEAKLLAQLEHPNLARVFDVDFHEGRPFLVMEYVPGCNLEQWLVEGRPLPRLAAALVAQVARAVAIAHRRGITHQDITPRNILLDLAGRPRLIDFGLARLRPAQGSAIDQPMGGTLGYMAPEQARGEVDRINAASDVFGLGGVLNYLLTAQPPFPGTDAHQVQHQTSRGEVDLSPLKATKAPRRLAAICAGALAPDPANRYATAEALANDLDRFLGQPRRRTILAAGGLVVVLMLGAGYWLLHPPERPPDSPSSPQYLIQQVQRGNDRWDLKGAVPLRSGDEFQIRCDLPRGFHAALFTFDSQGKFEHYPDPDVTSAGRFDRLTYPARLEGPAGTEFLLVCARRSPRPAREELETLFAGEPAWPQLPDKVVVWMDRDQVQVEGTRSIERRATRDATDAIETRLQKLQLQLRDRYEFYIGVAYAHR